MKTIRDVMAQHMGQVKLDQRLMKGLSDFIKRFVNTNEDHAQFFGGNLTGVHRVRFTQEDRFSLTEDILGIDDLAIQEDVRNIEGIGKEWIKGTDGLNLGLLYLVHLTTLDTKLSVNQKKQIATDALLILQMKFLSSIMTAYFKYPVRQEVALATYNALSGKYSIKKYKSWMALLQERCKDILATDSIHKSTIRTFAPDSGIQYLISDTQGRLKSIILNIYSETIKCIENESTIDTSGSMVELDGDLTLKHIQRKQTDYLHYLKTIAPQPQEFIKMNLVEVIDSTVTTMPKKPFLDTLAYFSTRAGARDMDTTVVMEEIIINTFQYIADNPKAITDLRDLSHVIKTLKDLYTAGKSTNPSILKTRTLCEKIAKKATKISNSVTLSGIRTGLILYIILRAFTKDHYS